MKTMNAKIKIMIFVAFCMLLAVTGCQGQPNIVEEQTVDCPFVNESEEAGVAILDPVLNEIQFGVIGRGKYDCDDPYIGGKLVALVEAFQFEGVYHSNGRFLLTPDGGGAWSGDCEITFDTNKSTCIYDGYGKFSNLQMTTEFVMGQSKIKYTVTEKPKE